MSTQTANPQGSLQRVVRAAELPSASDRELERGDGVGGVLKPKPKANLFCGDSSTVELPLFQEDDGGSIPTSPLQLLFRECGANTAAIAYRRWHYLGDQGFISQVNFGAYFGGVLEGAISYGPPNATDLDGYWTRHTQGEWWEIKRLVMSPKCPKNSESRFIAVSMRLLKKLALVRGVVTYADDGQGHVGTIYKAAGFVALGMTAAKNDFWVDGKVQQRGKTKGVEGEWKPRSRKWLFVKRFDSGSSGPLGGGGRGVSVAPIGTTDSGSNGKLCNSPEAARPQGEEGSESR